MRVAFISPRSDIVNSNQSFRSFLLSSPYMYFYNMFWSGFHNGLLTLAALTQKQVEMHYFDENYQEIPLDKQFDIVAITAVTQQATRAYQIADQFKQTWGRRTTVALGGSHVSFLPEEAKSHCDVVFKGEAENTWPAFIEAFNHGHWQELYDADDYGRVDLMKCPIPRYDLVNADFYKMLWIQTSRGCPRNCEFCSATKYFGRSYRTKSIEQVANEIREARKYLKFQQILFSDDNMFLQTPRNHRMLSMLKDLKISFVAQADIEIGNDVNFLEYLKECGCSILFIGFESLNQKNLELINKSKWKKNHLAQYSKYINNIVRTGIGVYGAFMLGYDWDTKETIQTLADFIKDHYFSGAQITVPTPLPGTDLRARLEGDDRLLDTGWENYTFFDVNIRHPILSKTDIEVGLLQLYKNIYNKEYLQRKNRYYKKIFYSKLKKEGT